MVIGSQHMILAVEVLTSFSTRDFKARASTLPSKVQNITQEDNAQHSCYHDAQWMKHGNKKRTLSVQTPCSYTHLECRTENSLDKEKWSELIYGQRGKTVQGQSKAVGLTSILQVQCHLFLLSFWEQWHPSNIKRMFAFEWGWRGNINWIQVN